MDNHDWYEEKYERCCRACGYIQVKSDAPESMQSSKKANEELRQRAGVDLYELKKHGCPNTNLQNWRRQLFAYKILAGFCLLFPGIEYFESGTFSIVGFMGAWIALFSIVVCFRLIAKIGRTENCRSSNKKS